MPYFLVAIRVQRRHQSRTNVWLWLNAIPLWLIIAWATENMAPAERTPAMMPNLITALSILFFMILSPYLFSMKCKKCLSFWTKWRIFFSLQYFRFFVALRMTYSIVLILIIILFLELSRNFFVRSTKCNIC